MAAKKKGRKPKTKTSKSRPARPKGVPRAKSAMRTKAQKGKIKTKRRAKNSRAKRAGGKKGGPGGG